MQVRERAEIQGNRSFFIRLKGSGNAFPMLLFEPMWGVPFNLFNPFFSRYMNELGCSGTDIGLITTVSLALQFLITFVAAPITDRLGRKRTTLIFDIVSWSIPVLIWIAANSFVYFLIAAVIQSVNRVAFVSWTCLMVEDTDKSLLVPLFSWLTVAGLLAGLFAPLSSLFMEKYSLVPTMRWLFGFAFVMMTLMFIFRNMFSKETAVGRLKMEQSKTVPVIRQAQGLLKLAAEIWRTPRIRFFFILSALYNIVLPVRTQFFGLFVAQTLGLPDAWIGYFALGSSVAMLAIYLLVQPRLAALMPRAPLTAGLTVTLAGFLLLAVPLQGVAALVFATVSMLMMSAGMAIAQPFIDGLCHANIDNDNRSNMTSVLYAFTLLSSAPFGVVFGYLFDVNARLPFLFASLIYAACVVLMATRFKRENGEDISSVGTTAA